MTSLENSYGPSLCHHVKGKWRFRAGSGPAGWAPRALAGTGDPPWVSLPWFSRPRDWPTLLHRKQIVLPSGFVQVNLLWRPGPPNSFLSLCPLPLQVLYQVSGGERPLKRVQWGPQARTDPPTGVSRTVRPRSARPSPTLPPLKASNHLFPLGLNQVLAHPRSLFYNCWCGWAGLCLQALNVPAGRSWIITVLFRDAVCHYKIAT